MKLKYNLYRIYQVIPDISHNLISNKYELITSLFLGKARIPLMIRGSNKKIEFETDQIPCMLDLLKKISPSTTVIKDQRVVEDGIITSAGVSSGIDMAFEVVTSLVGEEVANDTAKYIEYQRSAKIVSHYNYLAVPVINLEEHLLGIVTFH